MPGKFISSKDQYLDMLNLLGAKKLVYGNMSMPCISNFVSSAQSERRQYAEKLYAAPIANFLSKEQLSEISSWADKIITSVNEERARSRTNGYPTLYDEQYDYELITPVENWPVCFKTKFRPKAPTVDKYRFELVTYICFRGTASIKRGTLDLNFHSCISGFFFVHCTDTDLDEKLNEFREAVAYAASPEYIYSSLKKELCLSDVDDSESCLDKASNFIDRIAALTKLVS